MRDIRRHDIDTYLSREYKRRVQSSCWIFDWASSIFSGDSGIGMVSINSKGGLHEESVVVRFRRGNSTDTGTSVNGTCRTIDGLDRPLRPTADSNTGSGSGRRGGHPFP